MKKIKGIDSIQAFCPSMSKRNYGAGFSFIASRLHTFFTQKHYVVASYNLFSLSVCLYPTSSHRCQGVQMFVPVCSCGNSRGLNPFYFRLLIQSATFLWPCLRNKWCTNKPAMFKSCRSRRNNYDTSLSSFVFLLPYKKHQQAFNFKKITELPKIIN